MKDQLLPKQASYNLHRLLELPCIRIHPEYNTSYYTMGTKRREKALAKSIQAGLLRDPEKFRKSAWGSILAFFTFHRIKLVRHEVKMFQDLRKEVWNFDEDGYQASFRTTSGQPPLKMMGDLGYSGSV